MEPADHQLEVLASDARQVVDLGRGAGPRQERGKDVLAAERDRAASEGNQPEQLVVVDLAEARAAILVAGRVAVVLDTERPYLQVQDRRSGIGSTSR